MTGSTKIIGIRLAEWEHKLYMEMGGARWVRGLLKELKKEMVKEAHQKSPPSLKEKA